ncbi:ABC transporter ATP-binding protein [Thalassobacillus pellis]|uniref:ABC transporter ATP-binding protein n=1 Tax=Thalassobacillus pellis TaxID=748008 RepID=UPI001961338D|nr:ABC transporter ATP-binding protein [Thalassobacillus pellis]MBM7553752.1 ABC-2 type transport system ATP-binding protein [Thalassobacillus pellis]
MPIISVTNLLKKFDGHPVVNNISFKLEKGTCVALLGPNGAGKTTTLRMLSGLIRSNGGNITFEGLEKTADIRSEIGYLPQHPVFHNWMTGKEFLVYVAKLADLDKRTAAKEADRLLERVGISDAKNRRIGKYSGGMKQRLGIAQAMIHQPKLLILDEPVSALDPIGRREVLTLMEELKLETTLLFSTHILNDAEEVSDELLLMHKGDIVESGSLAEVRQKHKVNKIDLGFKEGFTGFEQEIKALPSVLNLEVDKNKISVIVTDTDIGREELLRLIQAKGWPLDKFVVGRATLEDLFMKVVQE